MKEWLSAFGAGALAGGALLIGAAIAWFVQVPRGVVAGIMAFGSGVLISALAFDLVLEAEETGGTTPTVVGFLAGAVAYVSANIALDRIGARKRERTGEGSSGSGTGIAVGALLDGVPESAVLGLSMVGGGVSVPILAAIFISNIPEGLASTADLKRDNRGLRYVVLLWAGIALACALASLLGFALLDTASPDLTAVINAIAAGAILAMICDTMIPEAFDRARALTGLLATVGFLTSFTIHQLS
ncbi:ZIP family metal transporter [Microbacteriaceae bacterium 4G12]